MRVRGWWVRVNVDFMEMTTKERSISSAVNVAIKHLFCIAGVYEYVSQLLSYANPNLMKSTRCGSLFLITVLGCCFLHQD